MTLKLVDVNTANENRNKTDDARGKVDIVAKTKSIAS